MGSSPTGLLMYGYYLGNEDDWRLREADEYGMVRVPWYDPSDFDADLIEAATDKLLAEIVGFTETDWQADGYFARKEAAKEALGVGLEGTWSGEYPRYVLAAHVVESDDDPKPVDFDKLERDRVELRWDERLQAALDVLGITPTQERPCWLVAGYYG